MIEFDLIDTLMDVLYAVAGLALLYVGIQLVRDEFKARKGNNAAPYKVPAPVATAPLGRKERQSLQSSKPRSQ